MCDEVTLCLQEYKLLFEGAGSNPGDKTLEDRFFEHEVRLGRLSVFRRVESQANLAKSETSAFTDRGSQSLFGTEAAQWCTSQKTRCSCVLSPC